PNFREVKPGAVGLKVAGVGPARFCMTVAVKVILPSRDASGRLSAVDKSVAKVISGCGCLLSGLISHDADVGGIPVADFDHVVVAIVAAAVAVPPAPINGVGDTCIGIGYDREFPRVVPSRILRIWIAQIPVAEISIDHEIFGPV